MPTRKLKASEAGKRWAGLIERVARADRAALAQLYDLSSPSVFSLVLGILGDRPAAEEITLALYTEIWKRAGEFDRDRLGASSWLFMRARDRAIE